MKPLSIFRSRRLKVLSAFLVMLAIASASCGGGKTTPSAPKVSFQVQRISSGVWAGAGSSSLTQLTDSSFHPFPTGHLVTTDGTGEALLQGSLGGNICQIYVFEITSLQTKACPKSQFTGSNLVTCDKEGDAVYQKCKGHLRMTPSAEVEATGTWMSLTYLPELQLTLVIVSEGNVVVWPVLDIESGELGDAIGVAAQKFLFTAPDDMPQEIAGLPARTPLPLERLPAFIDRLGLWPRIERLQKRAGADRVPFPIDSIELPEASPLPTPFVPEQATPTPTEDTGRPPDNAGLLLQGGGGAFEDSSVQKALAYALPTKQMMEKIFGNPDYPARAEFAGNAFDLHNVPYDPDVARELLAGAGYANGFSVVLIYPEGDGRIAAMADWMANSLGSVGMDMALNPAPADEAPAALAELVAAGEAALWLSRR